MNMNFKWITKEDVVSVFPITKNADETLADVHIKDAVTFDLYTVLPDTLLDAIKEVLITNPQQWSKVKTYSIGNVVWYDGWWKSKGTNTNSQPSESNPDWEVIELLNFWTDYIKPFLVASSVSRWSTWHGYNWTQYGMVKMVDGTFAQLSNEERAPLKADIENKVKYFQSRISKKLSDVNWTFDTVKYVKEDYEKINPNTRVGIFVPGKLKSNKYCSYLNGYCNGSCNYCSGC